MVRPGGDDPSDGRGHGEVKSYYLSGDELMRYRRPVLRYCPGCRKQLPDTAEYWYYGDRWLMIVQNWDPAVRQPRLMCKQCMLTVSAKRRAGEI